jgi:hypothetical protein
VITVRAYERPRIFAVSLRTTRFYLATRIVFRMFEFTMHTCKTLTVH